MKKSLILICSFTTLIDHDYMLLFSTTETEGLVQLIKVGFLVLPSRCRYLFSDQLIMSEKYESKIPSIKRLKYIYADTASMRVSVRAKLV